MKKRKTKRPYENDDFFGSVASSTECTGLTASVPENDDEVESYKEIYDIPLEPNDTPEKRAF